MKTTQDNQGRRVAAVQVWGKGYRVTADSEEFQRYVPVQLTQSGGLEASLASLPWGRVLGPLYAMPERELAAQRCLLFDSSELIAFSFARTEDRHRRPSIVLTTACVQISWESKELGDVASRAVSLTHRLASAYAESFRGNPEMVGLQLRENMFLPSRVFDLAEESKDDGVDWETVLAAVKQWRGVAGVATPKMLLLGANVVLGTKYEAERAQQQFGADGYFDVREKEIRPLSSRLERWQQPALDTTPPLSPVPPVEVPPANPDLRPIAESLDRIERTLGHLVDIAREVVEFVTRDRRRR
jgi:hypothetical protein